MKKVLFVCLGNICRSPMAEAILANKIEKMGLNLQISVDSCGTANYHINSKPDHRTVKVLEANGIKTKHLGRQFKTSDFLEFDYILAMDEHNYADIVKKAKNVSESEKVRLFREFDSEKSDVNVPDPYYGNLTDFENVYEMLNRCCTNFLSYLSSK